MLTHGRIFFPFETDGNGLTACASATAGADLRGNHVVAFVERFIQTLQQECLDYFIVFGQQHMDHLVSEMVSYYHEERPHQAKDNDPLVPATPTPTPKKANRKKGESPPDVLPVSQSECRQRLGGLLKHYYRKAA